MGKEYNEFDKFLKNKAKECDVDVPKHIMDNVHLTIKNLERKNKKKNYKKATMVASLAFIVFISWGSVYPSFAGQIPILSETFKFLNEKIGINTSYNDIGDTLNITQKVEDISLTIEKVLYDGNSVEILYNVKGENGFEKAPFINMIDLSFNNKEINSYTFREIGEFKDSNTYYGIKTIDIRGDDKFKKISKLKNIDLGVTIKGGLGGVFDNYKTEDINFKVKVDQNNIMKLKEKALDYDVEYKNIKSNLKRISKSSLGIYIESKEKSKLNNESIGYILKNDKGEPINYLYSSGDGENEIWRYNDLTNECDSLTVTPVYNIFNNASEEYYDLNYINKEIDFDKLGTLKVTNVEETENDVILNIDAKGYMANFVDHLKVVGDKNCALECNSIKFIEKEDEICKFKVIFNKISKDEELKLRVTKFNNVEILEDKALTINLDDLK